MINYFAEKIFYFSSFHPPQNVWIDFSIQIYSVALKDIGSPRYYIDGKNLVGISFTIILHHIPNSDRILYNAHSPFI